MSPSTDRDDEKVFVPLPQSETRIMPPAGKRVKRGKRGKRVQRVKRGKRGKRVQRVPEPARSALQSRTLADIANEQTAEQLALRLWAALVGDKVLSGMSVLLDELLQSHLLDDDDDEEGDDEGWLDDHHKRKFLMKPLRIVSTNIRTSMRSTSFQVLIQALPAT